MASPTKLTETIRKNKLNKFARNRNKKTRREAPSSNNDKVIAQLEASIKTK